MRSQRQVFYNIIWSLQCNYKSYRYQKEATYNEKAQKSAVQRLADASPAHADVSPLRISELFLTDSLLSQSCLTPELLRTLHYNMRLRRMSKVQQQTIPAIVAGKDVICQAATGTGKTLAYVLPVVHMSLDSEISHKLFRVLILAPTQDLAKQIHDVLIRVKGDKLACLLLLDPEPPDFRFVDRTKYIKPPEIDDAMIMKCTVLVSVPDNVPKIPVDYVRELRMLVLDEADDLLMFHHTLLQDCIRDVVRKPQILLFGATVGSALSLQLAKKYLPISSEMSVIDLVENKMSQIPPQIRQEVMVVSSRWLLANLVYLIQREVNAGNPKVLVYVTTSEQAVFYAALLSNVIQEVRHIAFYAELRRADAQKQMKKFIDYSNVVMYCAQENTRGIDFPGVSCVIILGHPGTSTEYIHKIGRTGRRGLQGSSILLLCQFERDFMAHVVGYGAKLTDQSDEVVSEVEEIDRAIAQALKEEVEFFRSQLRIQERYLGVYQVWHSWVAYYKALLPRISYDMQSVCLEMTDLAVALRLGSNPLELFREVALALGLQIDTVDISSAVSISSSSYSKETSSSHPAPSATASKSSSDASTTASVPEASSPSTKLSKSKTRKGRSKR